jgi:hypothetical protein
VEAIYLLYPRQVAKPKAIKAIADAIRRGYPPNLLLERTRAFASTQAPNDKFTPHPATWFNQDRFNDDPNTWVNTRQKEFPLKDDSDRKKQLDRLRRHDDPQTGQPINA